MIFTFDYSDFALFQILSSQTNLNNQGPTVNTTIPVNTYRDFINSRRFTYSFAKNTHFSQINLHNRPKTILRKQMNSTTKKTEQIYRSTTTMCVRLHCDHFARIMGHSFRPRVIYTVHKQPIHLSTDQSRPIFSCKFSKFNNISGRVVNKDNGVAFRRGVGLVRCSCT